MTPQRKTILAELRKSCGHPSADELYVLVRKKIPRISLGTVYRNLEILVELGEIQKLQVGGSLSRYDGRPDNHYHIRCMNCNCIDDAPVIPNPQFEEDLKKLTPYQVMSHRVEFMGLCPQCAESALERQAEKIDALQKPTVSADPHPQTQSASVI